MRLDLYRFGLGVNVTQILADLIIPIYRDKYLLIPGGNISLYHEVLPPYTRR